MNSIFFAIQATYSHVQLAVFKNSTCIEIIDNFQAKASSHLVTLAETTLQKNSLTLQDLDFLAVDKGPGAFTSLRVALATVNGIAFTRTISLVGVDGLDALVFDAEQAKKQSVTLALLNAYGNDVYYAIKKPTVGLYEKGCKKIDVLLAELQEHTKNEPIVITGNAYSLHKALIHETLTSAHIVHHEQATASAKAIGILALEQKDLTFRIEPNYLKSQYFAIRHPQLSAPHS